MENYDTNYFNAQYVSKIDALGKYNKQTILPIELGKCV